MIYNITYRGNIHCNQVGVNYPFPHYSTVLGSILSAYHKEVNTSSLCRVDMIELASDLNIELLIGYRTDSPVSVTQSSEFVTGNNSSPEKVKIAEVAIKSNIILSGCYEIVVKVPEGSEVANVLKNQILRIGRADIFPHEYKVSKLESFLDIKEDSNINWIIPKTGSGVKFFSSMDENELEMCLVSQVIPSDFKSSKLTLQGVYSGFSTVKSERLKKRDFISYKDLLQSNENKMRKELVRIHELNNLRYKL